MTSRRAAVLCSLLLTVALHGVAQAPAASTKSPEALLEPVAWLVGGTWMTDVKDPQDGSMTHVENHITWAPNRAAIQFVTNFNSKPHYNGFYAYDAAKAAIRFYYTSEEGQLTIGTATPDLDGKTLHQEFDVTQPSGTVNHIRSTIVRNGNDAYLFTVFMQKNGTWKQLFQIAYKRKA
jgi:uncharacterized protein YfaS (alpha-2-macroglobulin family)